MGATARIGRDLTTASHFPLTACLRLPSTLVLKERIEEMDLSPVECKPVEGRDGFSVLSLFHH